MKTYLPFLSQENLIAQCFHWNLKHYITKMSTIVMAMVVLNFKVGISRKPSPMLLHYPYFIKLQMQGILSTVYINMVHKRVETKVKLLFY